MSNGIVRLSVLAGAILMASAYSADAAVYCKYVGVPKGCVAKPGVVLVAAPAPAVVYCRYIGVPAGCVARPGVVLVAAPGVGAPGVGVRAGVGVNRGGPVNRVGRR
jgi:hypothetical protein